jgi:dienelactone hydrolase
MRRVQCAASGVIFAAAVALCGQAAAQTVETLKVERESRGNLLNLPVELLLPKTATGRVPAIIISHGSGGVRDRREGAYARAFNGLGVAGVIVDSFTPRGIRSTVNDQSTVTDAEMLGDTVAVLKVIAAHPRIDPERIGLIGFSKGGTVAIKAALRRYRADAGNDDAHFSLLIALYPWCGDIPMDFAAAGAPLVMLLGGEDTYVGTAACREYAKKFEAAGGKLTLRVYPGAKHDWDVPGSTSWTERRAQNSSRCIYEEVQTGKWIERSSGLTVFVNGAAAPDVKKARSHCRTIGASGGYDATTAKQSMQDITAAVRSTFHLD